MAIQRSRRQVRRTKPQATPLKELLSRLGQRTRPTAPKYAASGKLYIAYVWGRWTEYCQKVYDESDHFSSPDPVRVCTDDLYCEAIQGFLECSCGILNFTSASSLFTYGKFWRKAVVQHTRFPVHPIVKMDMKNYIMDVFIDKDGLKEAGRFKDIMTSDDVLGILYHHWVLSDDFLPTEGDRFGLACMDVFCGSTTARGGTVVESSGYLGTNEALEYRDIELYALRDTGCPGSVKLGARVQLRLLKGRRNRGNPWVLFAQMNGLFY